MSVATHEKGLDELQIGLGDFADGRPLRVKPITEGLGVGCLAFGCFRMTCPVILGLHQ
jgi:hypothetical protein